MRTPSNVAARLAATPYAARVRALNDALRRRYAGGRVVTTSGIAALPESSQGAVLAAVRGFDTFDARNDPYGEHDFGTVTVAGLLCFWKIDANNLSLGGHSPDPADPAVTVRVLTIMRAEEY
ncbi:DUF3768 domain-containing protein [Methylobacterium nigriterrae]|uniref:DUF3768 domain-containing protein n=1 Tax=Methylobacterium nigriterrae TaxID=3127512 RepID=UPI003013E387